MRSIKSMEVRDATGGESATRRDGRENGPGSKVASSDRVQSRSRDLGVVSSEL